MPTVTLNIDNALFEKAKKGMLEWGVDLDEVISSAILPYAEGDARIREYEAVMRRHFFLRPARSYARDENER